MIRFLQWLLRGRPMIPVYHDDSGFEWSPGNAAYVWVERGHTTWKRGLGRGSHNDGSGV